ncbi:MAG: hypothetical protein ACREBB_11220 [Nitrosotalea sp.]
MAKYRREIVENDLRNIHGWFKDHLDAEGGIFTEDKRRKLLGVKAKSSKQYQEDNADFWYDTRKTVKNGLKDLELFCLVAHPEQVKEIFDFHLVSEKPYVPSPLVDILTALFGNFPTPDYQKINETRVFDLWKAPLAYEIVKILIEYMQRENLITSQAHHRSAEEFLDMMGSEIGHTGHPVIR